MLHRRRYQPIALAIGVILLALVAMRVYFGFVPAGASLQPWILARVDGPVMRSPDGKRVVRVYFNDAGAMHSDNHWTWVVEDRWWCGRRVVASGYLSPRVRAGSAPVPLTWSAGNEVSVDFLPRRYGGGD